jgi:hypothetical protein
MDLSANHSTRIWRAMIGFVVASFLDFLMTDALLSRSVNDHGFQFVESNPVAAYFLNVGGTVGLAGFKIAMVAVVTASCRIIAVKRLIAARRILDFAAATGSSVVIYSAGLAIQYHL